MRISRYAFDLPAAIFTFLLVSQSAAQSSSPVLLGPTGNQTVTQPAGTTLEVNSLNGQLTVTAPAGTDISEAVRNALNATASKCGTVIIAPGSYSWSSANVAMLPCQTLQGVGAILSVSSPGTSPFLIVEGPGPGSVPTTNNTYTVGSIRGVTFVGWSTPTSQTSSTGIQLGSTSPSESAQLFNLYDVHIRSFGCGINIEFAHQIAFFGGSLEANYDGVCFANLITGLENINFHGSQIINNLHYGINHNQTGLFVEMFLTDCSIDYNGQSNSSGGQIQFTNGKLAIMGGHLENNVLPMITVMQPQAPAIVDLYISGAAFNLADTNTSDVYASFITDYGLNPVLEVGRGVSFSSQGAAVSAVADWVPVENQNSRLLMDPYTYIVVTTPAGLAAYVGTTPNDYSYPTYDVHDNITGITTSFIY